MAAFVVGGGAIGSVGSGFSGDGVNACISRRTSRNQGVAGLSAIQFPKLPSLPSLPKIGGGAKKGSAAPPTPAKKVVAGKSKTVATRATPKPMVKPAGGRPISGSSGSPMKIPIFSSPDVFTPENRDYEFQRKLAGQGATAFDRRIGVDGLRKLNNDRVNDIQTFRNMDEYTNELAWARKDNRKSIVPVIYKQVFGNAYLFESDLECFSTAESTFLVTGNVKEFIRSLALSDTYKSKFFETGTAMRFVELNFKHFLGRAPRSQAEFSEHIQLLANEGYVAEINSYLDSAEYDSLYGTTRVPQINFKGGHETDNEMNRLAVLAGPPSGSDVTQRTPAFPAIDASSGISSGLVYRGLPAAWRGENKARERAGLIFFLPGMESGNDQLKKDEVSWKLRYGNWNTFYYKMSLPYKQIMTPQLKNTDAEVQQAAADLKYGTLMSKMYVGSRKIFDQAPVIELSAPVDGAGGSVRVAMKTMAPSTPANLLQEV
eukprot:CAMPEP_0182448894 /NCGR_PEP_ID=MMETSP1172-20130603/30517_1 /TAXON_ID=708627 /ORGANISM="Timspurckia oligopyrenoides, Strain CCMP3278" /LENGTH=486 /DNA_ID=CAMNT_0024645937 /DNA_START=44 /DNA_END=1504 /DNA_ORIENTATION=-